MVAMSKKLTTRIVADLTAKEIQELGRKAKTPIWAVWGIATKAIPGETDLGTYLKFRGQFEAASSVTGEVKASANLIVPEVLQDLLDGQLSMEDIESVKFAGTLGVQPDTGDRPGVGYTWYFEPEIEVSDSNMLADLRQKMLPPETEKGAKK